MRLFVCFHRWFPIIHMSFSLDPKKRFLLARPRSRQIRSPAREREKNDGVSPVVKPGFLWYNWKSAKHVSRLSAFTRKNNKSQHSVRLICRLEWESLSNTFRLRLTEIERFMREKLIIALSEAKFYNYAVLLIWLFDDTIERKLTSREWIIAILLSLFSGIESHHDRQDLMINKRRCWRMLSDFCAKQILMTTERSRESSSIFHIWLSVISTLSRCSEIWQQSRSHFLLHPLLTRQCLEIGCISLWLRYTIRVGLHVVKRLVLTERATSFSRSASGRVAPRLIQVNLSCGARLILTRNMYEKFSVGRFCLRLSKKDSKKLVAYSTSPRWASLASMQEWVLGCFASAYPYKVYLEIWRASRISHQRAACLVVSSVACAWAFLAISTKLHIRTCAERTSRVLVQ